MAAPGESCLLAIVIMYFYFAGVSVFTMFIPFMLMIGGPFLIITNIIA